MQVHKWTNGCMTSDEMGNADIAEGLKAELNEEKKKKTRVQRPTNRDWSKYHKSNRLIDIITRIEERGILSIL